MTCSTGFAVIVINGIYSCEIAPVSYNSFITICDGDNKTVCLDTSSKYIKPCVCGFSKTGTCMTFEVDYNL